MLDQCNRVQKNVSSHFADPLFTSHHHHRPRNPPPPPPPEASRVKCISLICHFFRPVIEPATFRLIANSLTAQSSDSLCPISQFTEEKLGQAEKTELDAYFENLLSRADCTKNWTEKIFRQTEVLLQPNPSKF